MKETYVKPEIRSEVLESEALSCVQGSGNCCDDCNVVYTPCPGFFCR